MSDTSPNTAVLDPKRPWLTDATGLPSNLNWFSTLFNPGGASPKLHFTRAWTLLFFTQLFAWMGPGLVAFILTIAGGDGSGVLSFGAVFTPIVFILTTVLSFIIHCRRLNHADKSWLWSILVLIPLIAAMTAFTFGVQGQQAKYDEAFEARDTYVQDPKAWEEQQLLERREKLEASNACKAKRLEAEEAGTELADDDECKNENSDYGGQGQRGGGEGLRADRPLPDQTDFVILSQTGTITSIIMFGSFFVMLWSLFWVARTPNFNRSEPEANASVFENT